MSPTDLFGSFLNDENRQHRLVLAAINVMIAAEEPLKLSDILSRTPGLSRNPCDQDVLILVDILGIMRKLGYIVCTNANGPSDEQERFAVCPLLWMAHL